MRIKIKKIQIQQHHAARVWGALLSAQTQQRLNDTCYPRCAGSFHQRILIPYLRARKHVWRRRCVILRKHTWWVTPAARRPVRWNKSFCWLCSRAATHRLWLQHKVTLAPVCLPTKRYKLACADRWRRPRRCTAEEPQLVCNLFRGVSIGRQMSACHAIFFMWSRDALTVLCL